jgi:CHAT domain-containing protein/tetratricopeptide (TPR) repeat protein
MQKLPRAFIAFFLLLVGTCPLSHCQMKEMLQDDKVQGILPKGRDGKTLNLDFETGTLQDWTVEGDAFEPMPIRGDVVKPRRGYMRSGHQGEYWVCSGEGKGDKVQGTLTSAAFEVTHPWATFLIGGGSQVETCVEIERQDTKTVVHRSSGVDVEDMQRIAVDLTSQLGKEIRVRIVDRSSAGWGHINFDDFRFHSKKPDLVPPTAKFEDRYAEAKRAMNSCDYPKAGRLLRETLVVRERVFNRSEQGKDAKDMADALQDWAELCLLMDPIAGRAVLQRAIMMLRNWYGPESQQFVDAKVLAIRYSMLDDSHTEAYQHATKAAEILRKSRQDLLPIREAVFGIDYLWATDSFQPTGESKLNLRFVSRLKVPVTLAWFDGKVRKPHGVLQPNAEVEHSARSRQVWVAIDEAGQVAFACRAPDADDRIEILSPASVEAHMGFESAAKTLDLRAKIALRADRFEEAKASFNEAANIRRLYLPPHHPEFARWHTYLAEIERRTKHPDAAAQRASQAEKLWRQSSPDELLIAEHRTELEIGLAEWATGKKVAAEVHFARARKIRERVSPDHAVADPHTHQELALAFRGLGESEAAERYARLAAEESVRYLTARANRTASGLLENFGAIMDGMVPYLAYARESKRNPIDMHQTVMEWKGVVWDRELDTRRGWKALSEADPHFGGLLKRMEDASRKMVASQLATPNQASIAEHRKQTVSLYQDWWRIGGELHRETVPYRRRHPQEPAPIKSLQALLPADTAFVEYVGFYEPWETGPRKWRFAAFVFTSKSAAFIELGLASAIEAEVLEFQGQLQRGRPAAGPKSAGQRLRDAIWSPIEPHLEGRKTVLLAPDLQLCQLTFAALPNADGKKYLLDDYAFIQVGSTKEIARMLQMPPWKPGAESSMACFGDVDFGNPDPAAGKVNSVKPLGVLGFEGPFAQLPATRVEIDAIEKLFKQTTPKGSIRVLRGKEATAAGFREYAPRCELLHLATHGFSVGSKGGVHYLATTAVVFAGVNETGREEQGVVTALEMRYLDLSKVRLAVLSACETGLGYQSLPGDGIQGPHRALQLAGVRSVIVSHWKVDDEATRLLMDRFYENLLAKKLSIVESLRQAQLWLMRDGKSAMSESTLRGIARLYPRDPETVPDNRLPPSLWAPFVLHGDWR